MYQNIWENIQKFSPIIGFVWVIVLFAFLIFLVAVLLLIISRWKIFIKAGYEGWEAIVPFYSSWTLVKISGLEWWFFLIANATFLVGALLGDGLAPLAGIASFISYYFINYNISLKFDKDPVVFSLGLTFLPIIFYPILAFGKSTYTDVKVSVYGPVSDNVDNDYQNNNKSHTNSKFCKTCGNQVDNSKFCSKCGEKIH